MRVSSKRLKGAIKSLSNSNMGWRWAGETSTDFPPYGALSLLFSSNYLPFIGDFCRRVSAFLGARFPMSLALNKEDIPSAAQYIQDIISQVPIYGALKGVWVSAYHEMKFIRHQLSLAGKTSSLDTLLSQTQSITHSMNGRVLDCLQSAMSLREPTFVIPVNDFIIYESLPGMSNYATRARDNCCCWKKCSLSVEQWEENVHQLFQPRTLRCNPNEAWINCRACVSCLEGDGGIARRICSSGSCINDWW